MSDKKLQKLKGLIVLKKMRNADVVENFVECGQICQSWTENLVNHGNKLVNYSTTIAQYVDGVLVLNDTKYSSTTSTIQNQIKRMSKDVVLTTKRVPMGEWDLTNYVEKDAITA